MRWLRWQVLGKAWSGLFPAFPYYFCRRNSIGVLAIYRIHQSRPLRGKRARHKGPAVDTHQSHTAVYYLVSTTVEASSSSIDHSAKPEKQRAEPCSATPHPALVGLYLRSKRWGPGSQCKILRRGGLRRPGYKIVCIPPLIVLFLHRIVSSKSQCSLRSLSLSSLELWLWLRPRPPRSNTLLMRRSRRPLLRWCPCLLLPTSGVWPLTAS